MKHILRHFQKNDPRLYEYFIKVGELYEIKKDKPANYFHRLCKEIICQQLSDKSGDTIHDRFRKLFPKRFVHPSDVLQLSHEMLRSSGMSNAKTRYVKNLAEAIVNKTLPIIRLDKMNDEEIIVELTKVKGIGRWTAEMFLIFVLGRENVFSYGDLGLKKSLMKIYGFKKEPLKKTVEKIVARWSPYKSYASRILWESLKINP